MQLAKGNDSAVDHGARPSHKVDPSLDERMGWRQEAGRKEEPVDFRASGGRRGSEGSITPLCDGCK